MVISQGAAFYKTGLSTQIHSTAASKDALKKPTWRQHYLRWQLLSISNNLELIIGQIGGVTNKDAVLLNVLLFILIVYFHDSNNNYYIKMRFQCIHNVLESHTLII